MNDDSRLDCSDIHQEESDWEKCLSRGVWRCKDGREIPFQDLHYSHIKNITDKFPGAIPHKIYKQLCKLMGVKLRAYREKIKKEKYYESLPGTIKRLKTLQVM